MYFNERSHGTNGSSDSFYSPIDFGADPSVTETTSSDGIFSWVTGESFTVSESNTGMPLELRLGRREGFNRLDAIVFQQNSNLTDLELDALFTSVPEPGTALLFMSLLSLAILPCRRSPIHCR